VAKDQEVLTGEVTRYYHPNGHRPAKFIVVGAEKFELAVFPDVEKPWDKDTQLPAFMNGLPIDIEGLFIETQAKFTGYFPPKGEPNSLPQYKPSKITVLDSSPGPKAAPAAPAAAPAQASKYLANPNDRDTLIVDQVIFKGAIDLLRGDTTVAKAVEDAILAWEGVRARHLPKEEDTLEEDDFGSL
jgi:hypothetical protein